MKNYSAVVGILSAACFVVPAIRQERRRRQYANFLKHNELDKNQKLAQAVESFMIKDFLRWDSVDSFFLIFGIFLLAATFIMEIL